MKTKYDRTYEIYDAFWEDANKKLRVKSNDNIRILDQVFQGNQIVQAWKGDLTTQHGPFKGPQTDFPVIEYIWCYWMEESRIFDIIDQICARYTNQANGVAVAPELIRMDVSPLHTVAQVLWGYTEDMMKSKPRQRILEYMRQYGLQTASQRRAGSEFVHADMAIEYRRGFLRDFHNLLNACALFYKQLDDNTITEDPRPVFNALKTLNFGLSEGFHNQYMFLTSKVRKEIIVLQDILDLPEVQRFLGARLLANYPAPWMGAADEMRRLLRCNHTPITEFFNLAEFGELILLAARIGPFGPTDADADPARHFAVALRNQIMQYIHSYRAVTGVNLASEAFVNGSVDATPPAVYLRAKDAQMRSAFLRGRTAA